MDNKSIWGKSIIVAIAAFVALSLILRFFSFFPTVINHDESTYIVIGQYLLEGHRYFIDYIDTKPIGIFLLYSGLISMVGKSIFLLRMAVAIWVSLTAAGLYLLCLKLSQEKRVAFACGVIYIFYCSIFTYYGVSPNTELIFNGFTVWAFFLALGAKSAWRYLSAGFLIGIGCMIKYVVLSDAVALWILMGLMHWQSQERPSLPLAQIKTGIFLGLGMILPILACIIYYVQLDALHILKFYSLEVPGRYFSEKNVVTNLVFLLDFLGRFFPITIMAIWAWFKCRGSKFEIIRWGLLCWIVLDMILILLPGKPFGHYLIQVMPAISILAAFNFSQHTLQHHYSLARWPNWGIPFVAIFILVILLYHKKDYYDEPDEVREKAEYLQNILEPHDQIYTGNEHQILYFLLDRKSLTPYVHRSLLWRDYMIEALDINIEAEIQRIHRANPKYMLLQDNTDPNNPMMELYDDYIPVYEFGDGHLLYERKETR